MPGLLFQFKAQLFSAFFFVFLLIIYLVLLNGKHRISTSITKILLAVVYIVQLVLGTFTSFAEVATRLYFQ